ncbi:hypothetical protein EJ08DRAFT_484945 [Tothia fuscella]|uniref:Ubiquitin-like protease family profile domain-containing protein n=1 Tax=Tothia fuscella TaxID=1048955 RepID=A0A9P4TT97_9PEZI|nr:hypothetical protein EJ08DRAFT_484945 [Tothia fuscella]
MDTTIDGIGSEDLRGEELLPPLENIRALFDPSAWMNDDIIDFLLRTFAWSAPANYWGIIATSNINAHDSIPMRWLSSDRSLLLPIYARDHWSCAVIWDVQHPIAEFYDSLIGDGESAHTRSARAYISEIWEITDHKSHLMYRQVPTMQQTNYHDFGVFVLIFCLYLILDRAIPDSLDPWLWRRVLGTMFEPEHISLQQNDDHEIKPEHLLEIYDVWAQLFNQLEANLEKPKGFVETYEEEERFL